MTKSEILKNLTERSKALEKEREEAMTEARNHIFGSDVWQKSMFKAFKAQACVNLLHNLFFHIQLGIFANGDK